jgi:Fe-S cluster assembly protein SufD
MATLTQTPLLKNISIDWLSDLSRTQGEPAWVLELRLKALQQYLALAWPTARDERWKRTELALLKWDQRRLVPLSSNTTNKTPWISLQEAVKEHEADIKAAWNSAIDQAKTNKFMSLNLAVGFEGACLFVSSNQQQVATFPTISFPQQSDSAQFHLNFVVVESGADLKLWEDFDNSTVPGKDDFLSTFTLIQLKDNSHAQVYHLQHWNDQILHFQFQNVLQGANSKFNAVAVEVGGRIYHNELTIHLIGQGAENKVLGVLFGEKKQNFENWITQNHTAKKTTSDIQYRGALKGSSHSFFSGLVSIVKEAQQSDAYQSAKSLLLSKEARADAIPNLEILADDVKCSHGAAVGQVDEDQKYYLQTRGVDPETAEEIIIQGFFEPVIAAVPSDVVQEKLRAFIEEKLAR